MVEDKTPTESQPPLGGQVSVVEAQTPTTQQEAGLGATLTQDNMQEAVITALVDKQSQKRESVPTDPAKTPTEPAKTPTEPVMTPTEPVMTPTDTAKTPTEPPQPPIVQVMLTADDTPPSDQPSEDQPKPPVGGSFIGELKMQLEQKSSDTPPSVTVVIPPPMLLPSTQISLESQKSNILYTALATFAGSPEENTVSLQEGQLVRVVDQSQDEWWLVVPLTHTGEEEAKQGWVPANFLQALDEPPPSDHGSSEGYASYQLLLHKLIALIYDYCSNYVPSVVCR